VRHVYECPMRRDDVHGDGNLNNVFYLDYLQEARLDLLRHHDTDVSPHRGEGLVVVRTVIEYLRPVPLRSSVPIATWVTEVRAASFTLGYEVVTESADGEPVVHARPTTVLTPYVFGEERPRRLTADERARLSSGIEPSPLSPTPRTAWDPVGRGAFHLPVRIRFSDIDLLGHVNNVRYVEYVEEATTNLSVEVFEEAKVNGTVSLMVARTEIDYLGQMNLRVQPYDVWSRIAHVGTTSYSTVSEIRDGDAIMARARIVKVSVDDDARPTPLLAAHADGFRRRMATPVND
jgi:acyl-CoA thioester hydrolase